TLLLFKKYRLDPKLFLFIAVRSEARFPAFLSGAIDAAPLTPRDITQIGAMRVNTLADIGKEIQLVWNGVAVSNRLLGDNPALVERFLRALAKGREFARRYREPTIAMLAKHTPLPPDALLVDYDTAVSSMTDEGTVSDRCTQGRSFGPRRIDQSRHRSRPGQALRLQHHQTNLRRFE